MRRHCCAIQRTEGFVLLYTLWLLLGGVVIFATASALAMGRARGATASIEWLRSTATAESAAHDQMFRLVVGGKRALATRPQSDITVDAVRMKLDVINSDGLVDLNAANETVLSEVFAAVAPGNSSGLAHAVRSLGRLHSYTQLMMIEGLEAPQLACLLRYVTLSSGKPDPATEFAPEHVRLALNLRNELKNSSAVVATDSLAGNSVRIGIEVLQQNSSGRLLLIDAFVTGRVDRPIRILEWQWFPAIISTTQTMPGCAFMLH